MKITLMLTTDDGAEITTEEMPVDLATLGLCTHALSQLMEGQETTPILRSGT